MDWLGTGISLLIIIALILIVWAKVQGDTVIEILREIKELMSEK
jgi:hypothetical protein